MKLGVLLAGAAMVAAACAPAGSDQPDVPLSLDVDFIAQIPDHLNDAGRGASVAFDADGNVGVSYLLFKPVLRAGDIPPAVIAGDPQPPAVMLASFRETGWTRTSVTPQGGLGEDAAGLAEGIATDDGQARPGITTSLAIDAQGNHHVVWNTPIGLFYATDTGGQFGEPERVTSGITRGASIAVSGSTPWVSYYAGSSVYAGQRVGGSWSTESVATLSEPPGEGATTAIGVGSGGEPMVAFGDGDVTRLGRRSEEVWAAETIPSPGGLAVSMAVDANGNPHLADVDAEGNVRHAHSIGGGPWEVTDLGSSRLPAELQEGQLSLLGTDIAVDGQGVHFVAWNDLAGGEAGRQQVLVVTNVTGTFEPLPIPGGSGGADPAIAVSDDGQRLAIAWFDERNSNLVVVLPVEGDVPVAFSPQPTGTLTPTAPPPAECEPEAGVTQLQITAPPGAFLEGFDTDCLAVEPDTDFSTLFSNDDSGQLHNWSLYTDSSAASRPPGAPSEFALITGPDEITYEVGALDAGEFFYRCDVHPTTMTGTLVVAEAGEGG